MQINGNEGIFLIRKECNSDRICLEHQYGRRDVMWIGSIIKGFDKNDDNHHHHHDFDNNFISHVSTRWLFDHQVNF